MGPNLQAGAGFLAKRVQKSLNRAQEKVRRDIYKSHGVDLTPKLYNRSTVISLLSHQTDLFKLVSASFILRRCEPVRSPVVILRRLFYGIIRISLEVELEAYLKGA